MNVDDFPTLDVSVESITAQQLRERINEGRKVRILDTRRESGYEKWQIKGDTVESLNVPFFEFLDGEVDEEILAEIPSDGELVVVCAKGISSEFVAGRLTERGYDTVHLIEGMNGWARVYDAVKVERYEGAGTVYQYQRPSSGCLCYLLVEGNEAAIVDPLRVFTGRYRDDAASLGAELTLALDTHIHADHISGLRSLTGQGVEGVVPRPAADRGVTDAGEMTLTDHGDSFTVGKATVEVIHTPGHTSGMTSYLLDGSLLATGDGLFVGGVARPDLEAGSQGAPDAARQLHETLQERILTLPDETLVGGAHYSDAAEPAGDGTYTAPLGELVGHMDALSMDRQAFVDVVLLDMPPRPANHEAVIETNLGRRSVDDQQAFELELGPNNCAASTGLPADD